MPQAVQIVPEFGHPHTKVVVNNNTWFNDDVAAAEFYGVSSIFVITAPKGEDRKLIPITRASHFLEEFGVGSFPLNGQPYYNAYNFLTGANDVLAYVMRVTADDASYSNAVVVANVKANQTADTFEVYFEVVHLANVVNDADFETRTKQLREDTPDGDGFIKIPLFGLRANGRGEYGNALRFRMVKDIASDEENSFLNYRLDVYELEDTLKIKDAVKGSIYEDAVEGFTSLFIGEALNDFDRGKTRMLTLSENFEDLYEMYLETVEPAVVVPLSQFDFFYGKTRDLEDIPGYIVLDTAVNQNAITLEVAEGISLENGSDGIFARQRDPLKVAARETAIENAYIKAFTGEFDRKILFKRQTPQTLFFDANYPEAVKYEIITWLTSRFDGYGHLDSGIVNTLTDAVGVGERMYRLGHYSYGKHFQSHEIRDPFTNKKIRVTYTHFLAGNLPHHYMAAGEHIAYAAADAPLTGHVARSVKPDLDADDSIMKEQLYRLRMNYLETLGENVYQRGTQSTSDVGAKVTDWSDLNEENNVYVLFALKREIEAYVNTLTYDFASEEDRARFTSDCDRIVERYRGEKLHNASINFDMNPWEEQRSILHCYLAIEFRPLVKRSIIEIDINPRS